MDMTEKLYDTDAYLTAFRATVLAVREEAEARYVTLDRTAFFPEGGGQGADRGTLAGLPVLDVQVRDGIIEHKLTAPLPLGAQVDGVIDFANRFDKMQCHTAEHILSGIIHSSYGYDNKGFHLSDDIMTLDTSAPLTPEQLTEVEEAANRVVFANLPVRAAYPSPEVLAAMTYRSKLDLTENVRIVTIPGVDVCACCAPHVSHTGEIGVIKILTAEKHKSGLRLTVVAGGRALADYRRRVENTARIGALLSVKQEECADAVERLNRSFAESQYENKTLRARLMTERATTYAPQDVIDVLTFSGVGMEELRAFANAVLPRLRCPLVLLSPLTGGGCQYLIAAGEGYDLRSQIREWNAALDGKGGGTAQMVQGTFRRNASDICAYFASVK